jgi:hypothetical protein
MGSKISKIYYLVIKRAFSKNVKQKEIIHPKKTHHLQETLKKQIFHHLAARMQN